MQRHRLADGRGDFGGSTTLDRQSGAVKLTHTAQDSVAEAAIAAPERTLAADDLRVELRTAVEMEALYEAWTGLAECCLEPNAFLDPDFALAAFRHLQPPRRLRVLVVFTPGEPATHRMVALLPIVLPALPSGGLARAYVHKQAAVGVPLLDRALAAPALTALIGGLKNLCPSAGALVFTQIPAQGPTFVLLRGHATAHDQELRLFGQHERAAFFGSSALDGRGRIRRPRKNTRRQRRRLNERGSVSFRMCIGAQASEAMPEFLRLEASGWKGKRKTALAMAANDFAEGVVRRMGERGKLRIASLDLDGKAIAMGIILDAAGRSYFWKTAYDETLAGLSPGVLFVHELTERHLARDSTILVDSCATPKHPMINRLWPDRMEITDVAIALRPSMLLRIIFAVEQRRLKLRRAVKALLGRSHRGR